MFFCIFIFIYVSIHLLVSGERSPTFGTTFTCWNATGSLGLEYATWNNGSWQWTQTVVSVCQQYAATCDVFRPLPSANGSECAFWWPQNAGFSGWCQCKLIVRQPYPQKFTGFVSIQWRRRIWTNILWNPIAAVCVCIWALNLYTQVVLVTFSSVGPKFLTSYILFCF